VRTNAPPLAVVGDRLATDLVDVTSDLAALDGHGFWAVVLPFEGEPVCARFATVRPARPWPGPRWQGPPRGSWRTSLTETEFEARVETIRDAIREGDVYQVNLTRRLSAPLPSHLDDDGRTDVAALGAALARGNPAPFSAVVRLPADLRFAPLREAGVHVASASPERFLTVEGRHVRSSPIKGTAATEDGFTDKDRAENLMIVDLVRNDLGRVCEFGSVRVPALWAVERHPGLFHLVSTVEGTLRAGVSWPKLLEATFPPGSVTGAPKLAAVEHLRRLEPVERGPYCGAIGWVDADRRRGELNVAIRTFWVSDGALHLGTGGGITIDSDPYGEWVETELKARRLLEVASSQPAPAGAG